MSKKNLKTVEITPAQEVVSASSILADMQDVFTGTAGQEEEAELKDEVKPPAKKKAEPAPKDYRVIRKDLIKNLKVGEQYKREDKSSCKTWVVVEKDAETGKMLVSSSPKNTHNPRKEFDMEVVVIEAI